MTIQATQGIYRDPQSLGSTGDSVRTPQKDLHYLIEHFEVESINDDGVKEVLRIYNPDIVMAKLDVLPDYVRQATLEGLTDSRMSAGHYKIVSDKWGKKAAESKKYVETPQMIFYRAALLAAQGLVEHDPSLNYEHMVEDIFGRFVRREIFPNTPYMANGGHQAIADYILERLENPSPQLVNELEQEKKIRQQLFACFVLPLYDSRTSIIRETLPNAADIQASIGGTGFNFSNLRPANETIHGTGGNTDGPVAFMAMYSRALGTTMNQGGKRDGANMFMLDYNHPDIMRFLYSKREDGEIPAANISVAVDHPFMTAVKGEDDERFYPLRNPHYNPELRPHIPEFYTLEQARQSIEISKGNKKAKVSLEIAENGVDILSPWLPEGLEEEYRTIGKVKEGVIYLDAKKVMRHIAYGAWFNGEPGIILTGTINDHNPTHPRHFKDYLKEGQHPQAVEIIQSLRELDSRASLEELIDKYITKKDEDGILINLPIGVGEMRATNPCGEKPLLPYEACVLGHINLEKMVIADAQGHYTVHWPKLIENTKLMYEILDNAIDQNKFTIPQIEATQKSNRKIGIGFMGLANMLYKLEIPYNSEEARTFVDELLTVWEKTTEESSFAKAKLFGSYPNFNFGHHRNGLPKRNAIVRTIAPTGTTGYAAQTSGGMEPEYALAYTRTTVQGTRVDIFNDVLEEKLEKYPFFLDESEKKRFHQYIQDQNGGKGSLQEFELVKGQGESDISFQNRQIHLNKIKNIFVTTYDISPEDHIRMEAVVQQHVDDAISKTTNFRTNTTVDDVERAFIFAYEQGIKGVTFYRDGTRKDQPLKVKGGSYEENEEVIDEIRKHSLRRQLVKERIESPRPELVFGPTDREPTPFGDKKVYVTYNREHLSDGTDIPYESFVAIKGAGDDINALTKGYGILMSLAIKAGVDPEYIIAELENLSGETQVGMGENRIKSLPHAIGKALEKAVNKSKLIQVIGSEPSSSPLENLVNNNGKKVASGNLCMRCGKPLIMKEGCQMCSDEVCGYSKCK